MIVYNFLVRAYGFIILLSSINNKKAAQWVKGRRHWRQRLSEKIKRTGPTRIWVHCASYGEFEQGRPVIEAIRKQHPGHSIILSFFSPSGYEAFKDWNGADVVCYLPLDTKRNAKDFIKLVKPHTAIFIKYEFWVNFLFQLRKKNVPTFLVSAVFKPHHPFFKWYGSIFRRSLATFHKLFIQDNNSGKLLDTIGVNNYEVCGDTRFDRVLQVKANAGRIPYFETFCAGQPVIMAGSTWPKDEEMIIAAYLKLNNATVKLVLVPHNVDEKSISALERQLQKNNLDYTLYSKNDADTAARILIVDAMGLLSRLYHYATLAYIGGGFNGGLHNSLEAAVYGIPVTFYGKEYVNYNEAVDLLEIGAAVHVETDEALKNAYETFLNDPSLRQNISKKLAAYFDKNAHSTAKILEQIQF